MAAWHIQQNVFCMPYVVKHIYNLGHDISQQNLHSATGCRENIKVSSWSRKWWARKRSKNPLSADVIHTLVIAPLLSWLANQVCYKNTAAIIWWSTTIPFFRTICFVTRDNNEVFTLVHPFICPEIFSKGLCPMKRCSHDLSNASIKQWNQR